MKAHNRGGRWHPRRGRAMAHRGYESGRDNLNVTAFLLQDLDAQVTTFRVSADSAKRYSSPSQPVVRISELKPIASYSWIDAPTPTIAVPGESPWVWASECDRVKQIPLECGVQFIHHNASKMGDNLSPMLPIFAAIDAMHDDFAYKDLDFVADRNSLRKLLHYIDEAQTRTNFRIDVGLANMTCLFTWREENAAVAGQGGRTTKAPRECVTYKFGRLNILQLDDEDEFLSPSLSWSIRGEGSAETKAKSKAMRPFVGEVEASLGKLKTLLEDILRAVRWQGEGIPLTLVCEGGKLSLWKRRYGKPLGAEITSKFKGKESTLPLRA